MKKIQFYKLNKFHRMHDVLADKFIAGLTADDIETRLVVRKQAIEFLRSNGFSVDDNLQWVVWPTKNDYLMSVLRWS
jgi:hypothetical protein